MQLLCDIDDHYKFHHSLAGHADIGLADIMLLSFLRRVKQIEVSACLIGMTKLYGVILMNIVRVLNHINCKFGIGYSAMDGKEKTVLDNM